MLTFNAVKIDKLRLVYDRSTIPVSDRKRIERQLEYYFPDSTSFKKNKYIGHRFTPTKLKRGKGTCDNNIQMPAEEVFTEAFRNITLNKQTRSNIWMTEIHLTADYLLDFPAEDVIFDLSEKTYSRLVPELIQSNISEYSLYLKHDRELDSEGNPKFVIKFYNKVKEYYRRHNTYICKLNEPLDEKDIKQVGCAYNPNTLELNLEQLNILRIEIELHETQQVKKLNKLVSGLEGALTADLILQGLCNKTFYKTCETLYKKILKEQVFPENRDLKPSTEKMDKISTYALNILAENPNLLKRYKTVYEELGYGKSFRSLTNDLKKVLPYSSHIEALYSKIFHDEQVEKSEEKKYFRSDCSPYGTSQYIMCILTHWIYIWDDS